MKKLIVLGLLVAASALYAAGFTNVSQTVTGTSVNADKDTLVGEVVQLQDPATPNTIPKYRGLVTYTTVAMADTFATAPGGYGVYDTAVVTISGWWDGVKYPMYAFSAKGTLPDTFSIAIADTGAMRPLFFFDAISIDVVCTDSSGTGATDSLAWSTTHKIKLIER